MVLDIELLVVVVASSSSSSLVVQRRGRGRRGGGVDGDDRGGASAGDGRPEQARMCDWQGNVSETGFSPGCRCGFVGVLASPSSTGGGHRGGRGLPRDRPTTLILLLLLGQHLISP